MSKGKFINRKLAKRPGHAQRQARLALEVGRKSKSALSPKKERAIITFEVPGRKAAGNTKENLAGS